MSDDQIINDASMELTQAMSHGKTMHEAMTHLLWARHLIDTALRQMQDD